MSKTEKRYRNLAVNLGATKSSDARIVPPSSSDNPTYYAVFIGLLIVAFAALTLSALSSK
jgi:hypothetical protein